MRVIIRLDVAYSPALFREHVLPRLHDLGLPVRAMYRSTWDTYADPRRAATTVSLIIRPEDVPPRPEYAY